MTNGVLPTNPLPRKAADKPLRTFQLEVAAAAAYAETGARGKRRYAVGQLLSVRLATSEWVDVEVACDEDVVQPPSEEDEGQLVGEHAAKADSLQAVEEAGRKEVQGGGPLPWLGRI